MGNMRGLYLIYLTIAFSLLNSALIADEVRPIALQSDLAKATEWLHSYKEKSLVSDVYLLRKSNFFDVFFDDKAFSDVYAKYREVFPFTEQGIVEMLSYTKDNFIPKKGGKWPNSSAAMINFSMMTIFHYFDNNENISPLVARKLENEIDLLFTDLCNQYKLFGADDQSRQLCLLAVNGVVQYSVCIFGTKKSFDFLGPKISQLLKKINDINDVYDGKVWKETLETFFWERDLMKWQQHVREPQLGR